MKTPVLTVLGAVVLVVPVMGQEDFRNVDEGRPGFVEDAYPIKWQEWEVELGSAGRLEAGDMREMGGVVELKFGLLPNTQVGADLHGAVVRSAGTTANGVESFALHVLYNVNQESLRLPALAVRTDVVLPGTGSVAHRELSARVRAMMTRTTGLARAHLNVTYAFRDPLDGGNRVSAGLAVDRVLGLTSRMLVGDVIYHRDGNGTNAVLSSVGMRTQLTKVVVLDVGVSTSISDLVDGESNVGLTLGVSRTFGLGLLTRVPPYPNPSIR